MDDSNYWSKFWRRRVSRRRLLTGTALATGGIAAATVVGCGSDEPGSTNGKPTGGGGDGGGLNFADEVYPNDGRQQFTVAPQESRAGTLRYLGFDAVVLDRYDPHQTQFGPMYANQSALFSKLYMYGSHEEPTWENIAPDLAESQPETPDELTYIVKLRKGVKFHDTEKIRENFPSLAGRELTADDVIFSYQRQTDKESYQRAYYYRSSQYGTIEKMEKVDSHTIRFTTKEPTVPFRHFMADTNAMIIPEEIVDMEPRPPHP